MIIKILLADDHKIFREGLKSLIEKESDINVIGEADDGRKTMKLVREMKPDIVLIDISMPQMNGIEAANEIKNQFPDTKILALSMHSDKRFVKRMLEAGASGYLLKSCASKELVTAIHRVYNNKIFLSEEIMDIVISDYSTKKDIKDSVNQNCNLTTRELETLQLISEGKNTKEIASELNVSIKSIEVYRKQIMDKLNIHNIAGLIKYAIREGITSIE